MHRKCSETEAWGLKETKKKHCLTKFIVHRFFVTYILMKSWEIGT